MFIVDGITRCVTITPGDTGPLDIVANDYTFAAEDRAILSVIAPNGTVALQKILKPNGAVFHTAFVSADTQDLLPGFYRMRVRFYIHPYYNESGQIVAGDQIITFDNITMRLPATD